MAKKAKTKRKTAVKKSAKSKPAKKMGRPTKFQEWFIPVAKILKSKGLTNEEIAYNLGITHDTLYTYLNVHPDFSEAIRDGRAMADQMVEAALFKRAIGCQTGDRQYPPDVAAAKFWLMNRKPEEWREKREVEILAEEQLTIKVDVAKQALLSDPSADEIIDIDIEPLDGPTNAANGTDPL